MKELTLRFPNYLHQYLVQKCTENKTTLSNYLTKILKNEEIVNKDEILKLNKEDMKIKKFSVKIEDGLFEEIKKECLDKKISVAEYVRGIFVDGDVNVNKKEKIQSIIHENTKVETVSLDKINVNKKDDSQCIKSNNKKLKNSTLIETIVDKNDIDLTSVKSSNVCNDDKMVKPQWADSINHDKYGLFADFSINGITQRMRWIEPGRFMMGSPENEPERSEDKDEDETLHEVKLTHGYWLADTCCTQALWKTVMGKNRSQYKGDKHPVDQVSWNDCVQFIERINRLKEKLDLRLPTEAEWEYACRAGTTTPFSFGTTITQKQVNYKQNNKGTVDVKSFPCNHWGLYEMHGNVWEWCSDWYGKYPSSKDVTVNPSGPDKGVNRVLRGGGWFNSPKYIRSANRNDQNPDYYSDRIGFRFSRSQ